MDPETLYLEHRPFIEDSLAKICERHHVSLAERDDLVSAAHFHLVRDDYRVFRMFEGRAPLTVYLLTVLRQVFQDWRNTRWGRWRPSAAARRLGPEAILMETLCQRDGRTLEEAVEIARTNHRLPASSDQLRQLVAQLPVRTRRVFVSDAVLVDAPAQDGGDEFVEAEEAGRVSVALDRALAALTPEDRVLVRMRFEHDVPIAALARTHAADYQFMYRRLTRVLFGLRAAVEASGVSGDDAAAVLAQRGLALREEGTS